MEQESISLGGQLIIKLQLAAVLDASGKRAEAAVREEVAEMYLTLPSDKVSDWPKLAVAYARVRNTACNNRQFDTVSVSRHRQCVCGKWCEIEVSRNDQLKCLLCCVRGRDCHSREKGQPARPLFEAKLDRFAEHAKRQTASRVCAMRLATASARPVQSIPASSEPLGTQLRCNRSVGAQFQP